MKVMKGQPFPLGISEFEDRINFAAAVSKGESVKLLLYTEVGAEPVKEVDLDQSIGAVCCISLSELEKEIAYYNYKIDEKVFLDPYVKAIAGKHLWGEEKDIKKHEICGKIHVDEYNWENDRPLHIAYEDVIAYSFHVRGFTKDIYSDVLAKGTFEGVIEKIPYLSELL